MSLNIKSGVNIKSGIKLKGFTPPNGLSSSEPSLSAWQIKQDYPSSTDGLYWIRNSNINGGDPIQIYADMTTLGGGWTLVVLNTAPYGWDDSNTLLRNSTTPPSTLFNYDTPGNASDNYSILGWADYIKRSASGFDYMLDAGYRRRNGGAWTANEAYSFVETYNSQYMGSPALDGNGWRKNITELQLFPAGAPSDTLTWTYSQDSVEARMPWFAYGLDQNASLTTDGFNNGWWGTIISYGTNQWDPAPWMSDGFVGTGNFSMTPDTPRVIWYWVR